MADLFAYGTLQCPEVLGAVAGVVPSSRPALLRGHRRFRVRDACYPAVIADPTGEVFGTCFLDLPHQAWARLDAFEGSEYHRRTLPVLVDGVERAAEVYVLAPAHEAVLSDEGWDLASFIAGKDAYLRDLLAR